jgi:PAS domain S-box-containing protein
LNLVISVFLLNHLPAHDDFRRRDDSEPSPSHSKAGVRYDGGGELYENALSRKLNILLLEDDPGDIALVERELRRAGLTASLRHVHDKADYTRALQESVPDLVLADNQSPGIDGQEALALLRAKYPDVPFISLSGNMTEELKAKLRKHGATDFVPKGELAKLVPAIQQALSKSEETRARRKSGQPERSAELPYRAIFEASVAGIAIEDSDGKIIETNRALQQMLGFDADELRNMTRRDFTHAGDHTGFTDRHDRPAPGMSGPHQVEQRFVRKDGRIISGRLTLTWISDAACQPTHTLVMIEDMTERRRAEEEHLRYASVVEFSGDSIISVTFDGVIFSWNPAGERIFGYSAREANGRAVSLILPPEQEEAFQTILEKIKRGERIDNFETAWSRKNGSRVHVSVSASPIKDASGRVLGASFISRDIHDRKRAEIRSAAFSTLGERLSSAATAPDAAGILAGVADQLIGWDACNLLLCSPDLNSFDTIFNMDLIDGRRCSIPPRSVNDTPSPRMRQVLEKGAQLILREKAEFSGPPAHAFGNQSRASASLMYVPIRNKSKIVGIFSIHSYAFNAYTQHDLGTLQALADHGGGAFERIRAESENQKLAAFAQHNPNPVLELAADGSVTYFNRAALEMARSLGKLHPAEFLPPETAAIVKDCLASGESKLRHQTTMQRRVLSWSFYPIPAGGVVHCYAGDITDRLHLEAVVRQSQKLDSVGQLAGGIAHDFNNILTVILGHTALLTLPPNLPPATIESAQQISFAAERAANLTRQLLTFSRRQIMQPKKLDLNEVVNQMTKMLRRLLGEDITLQVNYAPGLPLIEADPGMMEQILMNLSINARDAMPKGGRLFINTSMVTIDKAAAESIPKAAPGKYVCLVVKDTGAGIAPEILPHIFEPFFTTKDVGKGTGLGLATVYGIVDQHHGWITVDSKVDEGSDFKIYLPVAGGEGADTEITAPEAGIRGGTETILVVEDEIPLRVLVRSILERLGYHVLEAPTGVAALGTWHHQKDQIQLLLTDMIMPHGMSGRDLAKRLLADKPELKVIYTSGYSHAVMEADVVLQEGLNFLQKPYHPRKLAAAVRDCLDRK